MDDTTHDRPVDPRTASDLAFDEGVIYVGSFGMDLKYRPDELDFDLENL